MDQDDGRDEDIVSARIAGTSSRALAKRYGCSNSAIEAAIDRSLSYELDARQRLRAVKVSAARCEQLLSVFLEKAMKSDTNSGLLCIKAEERLACLFGLDQNPTQRVDIYQVEAQQQPTQFEKIQAAIMRMVNEAPPAQRAAIKRMEELGFEKALELLNAGNGASESAVSVLSNSDDDKPSN